MPVTLAAIEDARRRIAGSALRTPLVRLDCPDAPAEVYLKLENLQPTGSFKVRGALAALSAAGGGDQVVTASTGNHALGVAWAARRLGVPATIVVPASASPAKLAALQRLPATVIVHGGSYDDAEQHALSLAGNDRRYLSADLPRGSDWRPAAPAR